MQRLTILGLGPGDPGLLTREAEAALSSAGTVLVRTRHHPTVAALDPAERWPSCDDLYASAAGFDTVYAAIVARVLDLVAAGPAVYAVPGHPLVAERTVPALISAAREAGHDVRIIPGLSFVDAAATTLGIDLGRIQVCDALDLRIDTWRPALVAQVYDRDTASRLKLALLDLYPADHRVTILRSAGSTSAHTWTVPLAELDHRPLGYLDSIYLPAIAPTADVRRFDGLHAIVSRLHAPDGCPWDREQTHASLRRHLIEEAYEVLDAIDSGDVQALAEELGDLLLQVLMHTAVAEREGEFTLGDVTEQIATKLIRRHPHVFGGSSASTAEEVARNWDAIKQVEKPDASILDGIPTGLPALAASQAIQGRARRIGFDWPAIDGPLDKLTEEVREFAHATSDSDREEEFGDILFVLANIAQRLGIDAEQALRAANAKFRTRFAIVEQVARGRGLDLRDLDLPALDALWDEAKAATDVRL
jgi:tetrapyrrole methylase family protein/MazG family protein